MHKKRAPLNRTISINKDELKSLSEKLIRINKKSSLKEVKNKIINQDLFEVFDYLPANFIDLLIIDPPYNLSKKFNSNLFKSMESNRYEVWFESWFSRLMNLLKETASVYVCGDWQTSAIIIKILSRYLIVRNRITWEREKGRGANRNWKNCTEDIWFLTKSNNYTFNVDAVKLRRRVIAPYRDDNGFPKDWAKNDNGKFRDTFPSNVWTDISIPFWSMPENTDHPTQKPEKLIAKIILASSNKNQLVFDPFLGSGTSAVVAKKLGRHYCGVEVDRYYASLAQKRLEMAEKDKSIQGFTDGVFWERNTLKEQRKKVD